jgi:hypothetical protein
LTTQTKNDEGGIALSCEVAPVGDGKQFGKARHAHEKMILPCVYGLFGRVCAMDVRWSVLNASLFRGDKHFNVFGLLSSLCSRGLNPCSVSQV